MKRSLKALVFTSFLGISSLAVGVSHAEYYTTNNGYVPQQYTQYAQANAAYTNNLAYSQQQQAQQMATVDPSTAYTQNANAYYQQKGFNTPAQPDAKPAPIFIVNNTQRMTNPIAGYGQVQNPYEKTDSSGFYLGLAYINAKDKGNGFVSDTKNDLLPGNWVSQGNTLGKSNAFGIFVGAQTSGDMRTEISYNSYSGLRYADYAEEIIPDPTTGDPKSYQFPLDQGGNVSLDSFMVNFQYSLQSLIGTFLNGMISPYVGFGFGTAFSKVSDYTLIDSEGYSESPSDIGAIGTDAGNNCVKITDASSPYGPGQTFCGVQYYDGRITYQGNASNSFSWNYEVGLTIEPNPNSNFSIDIFYRRSMYGQLSTSGNVNYNYGTYYIYEAASSTACSMAGAIDNGDGTCSIPADDNIGSEKGKETANLDMQEIGLKIRTYF